MLIPIQLSAAPLPEGKGHSSDAHDDGRKPAVAWQREMERAQMELWLRQRPLGHGNAIAPSPELPIATVSRLAPASTDVPADAQRPGSRGPGLDDARESPSVEEGPASDADRMQEVDAAPLAGIVTLAWFQHAATPVVDASRMPGPLPAQGGAVPLTQRLALVWNEVLPGAVPVAASGRIAAMPVPKSAAVLPDATAPMHDKAPPPVQQPPVRVQYHLGEAGLAVWLGVDRGVSLDVQALVMQLRQALERQGLKLHSLTHNGRSVLQAESDSQVRTPAGDAFASSFSTPSPGAAP